MNKNLLYFVDEIETPFVINDIRKVSTIYQKIFLFSINKIQKKELLPVNVVLIDAYINWSQFKGTKILLFNFWSVMSIYLNECFDSKKFLPFKKSVAVICSNIFKANEVLRHLNQLKLNYKEIDLLYSFWFYDCIYLAWLKRFIQSPIVTRTHSGDLYEDHISIRNKLLFRNFQMKNLNAIYPVSKMGTNYLQMKYPKYKEKIKCIFLGSKNYNSLNPFNPDELVMVSCASFRHHKRIHKIAEALLLVNSRVTWYHFGNENLHTKDPKIPEYIELKSQVMKKPNVQFIPVGFTENEALMDFYKNTTVSFFISLSAAEGIPVSIMEAIGFGIPVLSTDVGGCAEIVNEQTGHLIPLKTDAQSIANWIDDFASSPMNTEDFRQNVRVFWEQNFDFDKNYDVFFENLKTF
jgi:colanic acid/amylovoran biosynthesis glycosyltransferase